MHFGIDNEGHDSQRGMRNLIRCDSFLLFRTYILTAFFQGYGIGYCWFVGDRFTRLCFAVTHLLMYIDCNCPWCIEDSFWSS